MNAKILFGSVVFACITQIAPAQTANTWTMDCLPNTALMQPIQTGSVRSLIAEGSCAVTGNIAGVTAQSLQSASYQETSAILYKAWGLITETFANGAQVTYTYQATAAVKNGVTVSGVRTYQITGGSGSMKGITGSGTCSISYIPTGGSTSTCNGTFKLP